MSTRRSINPSRDNIVETHWDLNSDTVTSPSLPSTNTLSTGTGLGETNHSFNFIQWLDQIPVFIDDHLNLVRTGAIATIGVGALLLAKSHSSAIIRWKVAEAIPKSDIAARTTITGRILAYDPTRNALQLSHVPIVRFMLTGKSLPPVSTQLQETILVRLPGVRLLSDEELKLEMSKFLSGAEGTSPLWVRLQLLSTLQELFDEAVKAGKINPSSPNLPALQNDSTIIVGHLWSRKRLFHKQNISIQLLERGLATVDYDFLEASKHMSEMLPLATLGALVEAETKAKRSRAGIWKILHEQEERQKAIERKRWLAQALAEAQLPKIEIKETINTVKSKIEASAPDTSKILQTAKDTLQGSLSKAQEKMSTLSKDLSPLLTKLPEEISKVNIKDKLSQLTKHLPSPEDVRNSTQSLAQKLPNSPIFDKSKIKELISSKLKKKQE